MADISDVESSLVAQIANALFSLPLATETGVLIVTESGASIVAGDGGGYQAGSFATSNIAAGTSVKLYRGFPVSSELDADVAAGKAHISVFPDPGMTRNVTRYQAQWVQAALVPSALTVKVVGNVATFGGSCAVGQVIAVLTGLQPHIAVATYTVLSTDTPTTVTAALAALIAGATSSGASLTCTVPPSVRIGMAQTASLLTRQQVQGFRISFWCPTPSVRDALCSFVDSALSQVHAFTLPSGEFCRLIYAATMTDDMPSKDKLWCRHLRYTIEYPTVAIATQQEMTVGIQNNTLNAGGVITLTA